MSGEILINNIAICIGTILCDLVHVIIIFVVNTIQFSSLRVLLKVEPFFLSILKLEYIRLQYHIDLY